MSNTIKLLIIFFFSLKLSNLTITYIFSENSIYNKNKNINIQNTTLEILNNGQYIIKGICENTSIIINSNYVTLYIISSHLNSRFNPLIIINENIKNIIINLKETVLSSSFDSGIIQLKKNTNLIINSKASIFKGGVIIKGEKKSNIKMNGRIGLSNSIKYIYLNLKISEDFIFVCENEKIKLDEIYIEITSDSIFEQKQFCFNNLAFLDNNKLFQSIQNLNNETNLFIKIKKNFENNIRIEENNTFYLDYLYFKHVNIAKEKCEEKILKKSNITFKPKVSVIIPIYNVQNFLIDCLDSIVKQSLKEIEIICVNDGSTDDSLSLLLNYSKIDNRIMIIDQRNRGLSEARNTGIKFSNGEFIYFLDSDDLLRLNALYELYEYSKKYNLDIIYFQSIEFKLLKKKRI